MFACAITDLEVGKNRITYDDSFVGVIRGKSGAIRDIMTKPSRTLYTGMTNNLRR